MQPLDDDHNDMDEFEFESFAATRRLIGDRKRPQQQANGRRSRSPSRNDHLNSDDWGDYDELEFDKYYEQDFDNL